MSTILIFDLDDTLYPERSYVQSGFRAVAARLEQRFGWNADEILSEMTDILGREGRGAVFNRLLARRGIGRQADVVDCVRTYRHHWPSIALFPSAELVLHRLSGSPYLVTDGHKVVQNLKVQALNLESRFVKIFMTHRYGIRHAKPSTHCFDRIRERERCQWEDLAYVGDNPAKDFVNLTPLGVLTVRVLTGEHGHVRARSGSEARVVIEDLSQLPDALPQVKWNTRRPVGASGR